MANEYMEAWFTAFAETIGPEVTGAEFATFTTWSALEVVDQSSRWDPARPDAGVARCQSIFEA